MFIEDFNELSKYMYIITFIGDDYYINLVHLMFLVYDKKLLSKNTFKKIKLNKVINISLFGVGISVILLLLTDY